MDFKRAFEMIKKIKNCVLASNSLLSCQLLHRRWSGERERVKAYLLLHSIPPGNFDRSLFVCNTTTLQARGRKEKGQDDKEKQRHKNILSQGRNAMPFSYFRCGEHEGECHPNTQVDFNPRQLSIEHHETIPWKEMRKFKKSALK